MKLITAKRICVMFCVNHILAGTFAYPLKRKLLRSAGYEIGENTRIAGPFFCTGTLKIGKDCWIGRDFRVEGNGIVEIGDRCDVAPGVMFLTGGHEIGSADRRAGKGAHYRICVGDGVWIGARATLARNIIVGEGSAIAACAYVGKDVPRNSLVGGVPARIIRELDNET